MCGRYRQARDPREVAEVFETVNPLPNRPPSWNIAPTQDALVVRRLPETGARQLGALRWGLVPHPRPVKWEAVWNRSSSTS
jgi:putative SOS response-associated peptidase YedK